MRPKISIATTCKGRLHHLRRSLPRLIGQEFRQPFEVVLVDFGCPDHAGEWAKVFAGDRGQRILRVVRATRHVEIFHMARAKNIGGVQASGEFVAFVDADYLLPADYLADAVALLESDGLDLLLAGFGGEARHCESEAGSYEFPDATAEPHSFLCPIYRRSVFLEFRGHDEAFTGWGYEDADLNRRVMNSGRPWAVWRPDVRFLHHDEADSLRFMAEQNKEESSAANLARGAGQLRTVNPGPWGQL